MYLTTHSTFQTINSLQKKIKKKKKIRIMSEKNRKEAMEQNMFSEEERQVAQLLLQLPRVIFALDEAALPLPFTWARKRRRSAIRLPPPPPPPPPPLSPSHHGGAAVVAPPCEAASPATPLSLSLTESDDKTKKPLRSKASLKRKREYYLKIIEDLTQRKASLTQEIDNVKRYSDQLKAFNLKLKARKQELYNGPNKSECKTPILEIGRPMQLVNASVNSSNSMAQNQHHQLQLHLQLSRTPHCVALMLNQASGPSQICSNQTTSLPMPSSSSSPSALGRVNTSNTGPLGIFDLNFSPEKFIQVDSAESLDVAKAHKDLSRAMAAQARQRRIQINRLKKPIANSKLCYSYR